MSLAHLLRRQACQHPEAPAIFDGSVQHASYGEWAARSAGLAQRLRTAGLAPGDRVLLFGRNHPRYLEVLWGLWWAGLVAVPVNAKLHPREVEWIIDNCGARWAFVTGDVAPSPLAGLRCQIDLESDQAAELLAPAPNADAAPITERSLDDTAWLFYTSGTTGRPKGVMLTQRNLMTMGLGYFADVDPIARGDAIVYAAPISHGAGIYAIPHLMAGARHVVPASRGFDPVELFALGREVGPLSLFAAPTIVGRLVDEAERQGLSPDDCARCFKTIVYGGAPMYLADIQRALRVMGPRFVQIYGQGETPMVGTVLSRADLADTAHPRHLARIASIGVAQTPVRFVQDRAEGLEVAAKERLLGRLDAGSFAQHVPRRPADGERQPRVELRVGEGNQARDIHAGRARGITRRGLLGKFIDEEVHDIHIGDVSEQRRVALDLEAELVGEEHRGRPGRHHPRVAGVARGRAPGRFGSRGSRHEAQALGQRHMPCARREEVDPEPVARLRQGDYLLVDPSGLGARVALRGDGKARDLFQRQRAAPRGGECRDHPHRQRAR